jgi:hypothetical protein
MSTMDPGDVPAELDLEALDDDADDELELEAPAPTGDEDVDADGRPLEAEGPGAA